MPKKGKAAKHPKPQGKKSKGGGGGGGGGGGKKKGPSVGGTSREDKKEFNMKHHSHGDKQFHDRRHHHKPPPVKHSKYDDIALELVEEEKLDKEYTKVHGHHPHHHITPAAGAVH